LFSFARNSYWMIHFDSEWALLIGCWYKTLNICSIYQGYGLYNSIFAMDEG